MNTTNLTLEQWPLSRLIPYARNPRKNDHVVEQMIGAIKEFGFKIPIVAKSDGTVVDGHLRLKAAHKLKLTQVPVVLADDLTPTQIKAFRIMANQSAYWAEWDDEFLALELQELNEQDFDLNLFDFDDDDLNRWLSEESSDQDDSDTIDQAPSTVETMVSQVGDLWQLGEHRLLCGDAVNANDFNHLMNGKKAAMAFTDPPFNVAYGSGAARANISTKRTIINDNLGNGFEGFLADAFRHLLHVTDGAVYITFSTSEIESFKRAFAKADGYLASVLIWVKNHFTVGGSDYQRRYEPILYGWRNQAKRTWRGGRNQSDVWEVAKNARNDLHPTMKPVALIEMALENSSKHNDYILDPFGGSGSTLIACEQQHRRCLMMELDPHYVDVIIRRWQALTGKEAVHAETQKIFNEFSDSHTPEDHL